MSGKIPPIRSWLYAPGNNTKLLDRVFIAGADAVILDLEDAVPFAEKARARELVAETVRLRQGQDAPVVSVRINHPETGLMEDDISAVVQPGLEVIRVPKMEHASTVRDIDRLIGEAESNAGMPVGGIPIICSLETAVGVWNVLEIAQSTPRVMSLGLGDLDFLRDVNATSSAERTETLYARSRIVLASRVAGIRPPTDGVFPHLQDEETLARTTREAKALGFFGRTVLHPKQLDVIHQVFTPSAEEVERARNLIDAANRAVADGLGVIQLPNGEFVDPPVVARAQNLLDLADRLGKSSD